MAAMMAGRGGMVDSMAAMVAGIGGLVDGMIVTAEWMAWLQ